MVNNDNLIDPDAIARALNPTHPNRSAIAAARQAILRCRELMQNCQDFTMETTLAGHGAMSILRAAKSTGYRTLLLYIAMDNPDLHIERVQLRASRGGHNIPDADIRRRYLRSLSRAPEALRLADEAAILDNSGFQPERIALLKLGRVIWKSENPPPWVVQLIAGFESGV